MVKKMLDLKDVVLCDVVESYLKSKKPQTASAYRTCLKRFRKFYDKDLTEFINEIEEQREVNKSLPPSERRRQFDETANEFISWMKDLGYANNPIRGSLAALQNFFKYYDVPVTFSFVNLPEKIGRKRNGKHKWKIDEIKRFVDGASTYKDKAIIMCMFQSGLAVGEICSLDYGDVDKELKSGELPVLVDIVRQKNSNQFKTLFGADAVKYLKLYLGERSDLKSDSPLFLKERERGGEVRITETAIQGRFRNLADKIFGVVDNEMNPYRPHSMRSAFRSRLTNKVDPDLIKFWMGDKLGAKAGAYLNLPDEEHRELYMAVEGRLSVEATSMDVMSGRPSEAKDSHLLRAYQERLSDLESRNESLDNMIKSMAFKLGEVTGEVEELKARESVRVESMVEKIKSDILSKIESGELRTKLVDESEIKAEE